MAWWIILVGGASMLRDKVNENTMRWLNRVGGIAVGVFGLINIVISRGHGH
jgi:hypothetical protein